MQTSLYSMTGRDVVQDSVACTIPQACSQEEGQDAQEITETNSIDGLGEPENDKDAVETKLAATIEIQEATIHHQNAEWNELLRKHERLKIKYQELDKQNAALRSLNEVLMAEQQQQAMAPTSGVISHRKGERNGSHETIHESRQDGSYRRDDPATARANLHKYNEAIQFLEAVGCDDFETCLKQWRRDCTAKVKAEEQFQALQKEALNTVDRFVPELDTAMQGAFRDLNKSIGLLTRVDALNKLVLQDLSWDKAVLWPNTLSTAASLNDMEQHEDRVKKKETRLLLRQALWKLYAEELMDPARPFSSFGGRAGHLAAKLDFADWFPDHPSDEYAAKWRSMTVAYLDKMDDEPSRQQVYARLTDALADMLYGKMEGRSRAASLDDVHAILAGDAVAKRLRKVNKEAVALARLFAKQRAGFTVEAPDLVGLGFRKRGPGGNGEGDADALLTSDNSVGVAEAEEDRSGDVMLLGSPMLCKWGDGDGKDLHQRTVLMKAYVHLFEDDWGAE